MRWYTRLRRFVGRNAGSFVLVPVGILCVVFAIVIRRDEGVAVPLAVGGVVMVLFGAAPDIEEVSGSKEGIKVKRSVPPTARLAASPTLELSPSEPGPALWSGDDIAQDAPDEVIHARLQLGAKALNALLHPDFGPLADATLHLYLYDRGDDRLRALGVSGPPADEGWKPGTGATGAAWELGEYVLAEGDAVYDATYGLSPEQQERARDLAVVAAMPVVNANGDMIAILTASSAERESPITTDEGFDEQLRVAQLAARVLIDVLKWAPDAYDAS